MKTIEETGAGKMNTDIMDPARTSIPTLSSKVMFWRPKYLAESKWLEHIPFYFWLVEAQQPELVFEPEITSGVTYFSICQAVDKLNLDTQCIATTNQESNFLPKINQYNHENYREFSVIDSEGAKEKLLDLPDNSVDILVLKNSHSFIYDKDQMDRWQKKLSDRAVVLIHGTQNKEIKPLCRNLKETYKTIEFVHGGGLLVVCFGDQQSPVMSSFFQQNNSLSSKRLMQNIYSRLGSACSESWLNETLGKKVLEVEEQLEQTSHQNTELSNKNTALHKSVEKTALEVESINKEQARLLEDNKKSQENIELRFNELSKLTKILHESDNKIEKLAKVDSDREIALETLKADSKAVNDKLSKQVTLNQKNDKKLSDLESANALLIKENTSLRSDCSNQAKLLIEQNTKLAALQKEISSLKVNNSLLESDQVATASIIEEYKLNAMKAEQSLADRFNELAVLTSMLRDQEPAKEEGVVTKVNVTEKTRTSNATSVISKIKSRNKKKRSAEKNLRRQILLIQESNLFDSDWYQAQYPETKKYKGCAIRHFLEVGGKAGFNPSPMFSSAWYFGTHPDVAEAGVNPLVHYIEFGKVEGREVVGV